MSRFLYVSLMFTATLLVAACQQQSATESTEVEAGAPQNGEIAESEDLSLLRVTTLDPPRNTVDGRWILVLTQSRTDFHASLFDIQQQPAKAANAAKGKHTVEMIGETKAFGDVAVTLKSYEIDGEHVHLAIGIERASVDFQGELRHGVIQGNVVWGAQNCDAARLVPASARDIEDVQISQSTPGKAKLDKILQMRERLGPLKKLAQSEPHFPIALSAYEEAIAAACRDDIAPAELSQLVKDYLAVCRNWGDRMVQVGRINAADIITASSTRPDLDLLYIDEAEAGLKDESLRSFSGLIAAARARARIKRGLLLARSESNEKSSQGAKELASLREEFPYNADITLELADFAERKNNVERAIELVGELVAMPMVEEMLQEQWKQDHIERPLPSEILVRLWKKQHGTTDGLDDYLDGIYRNRLAGLVEKQAEPSAGDDGRRVALLELFTNAHCAPCIGADIAITAAERTLPPAQAVVLRYHVHTAGPDPLTVLDSEMRYFEIYKPEGTPFLYLNGELYTGQIGGFMQQVGEIYHELLEKVGEIASQPTDARIKIAADAHAGRLRISADVSGLKEVGPDLRLVLVLAENGIKLRTPNGIRYHNMLVRYIINGPRGIEPVDGQLAYAAEIPLEDIKQRVVDYLAAFEKGQGLEFSVKPLALQNLQLVGFVQDAKTLKVLQAAAVPVGGKLDDPDDVPDAVSSQEPPPPKLPEDSSTPEEDATKPKAQGGPQLTPPAVN